MIITCNNCNKKFNVDSSMIPEKGRLLQCSGCNHKWFFKKQITNEPFIPVEINKPVEKLNPVEKKLDSALNQSPKSISLLDNQTEDDFTTEKVLIKSNAGKNKKNYNILILTIVFIISFIALIIVLDTFQSPISKIVPNIEFLLYNLYETINDIRLFITDLI